MAFRAHFDGKAIVPDEPVDLTPNQPLIVITELPNPGELLPAAPSALAWIADHASDSNDLPADLSQQHDHYLYGMPKKQE